MPPIAVRLSRCGSCHKILTPRHRCSCPNAEIRDLPPLDGWRALFLVAEVLNGLPPTCTLNYEGLVETVIEAPIAAVRRAEESHRGELRIRREAHERTQAELDELRANLLAAGAKGATDSQAEGRIEFLEEELRQVRMALAAMETAKTNAKVEKNLACATIEEARRYLVTLAGGDPDADTRRLMDLVTLVGSELAKLGGAREPIGTAEGSTRTRDYVSEEAKADFFAVRQTLLRGLAAKPGEYGSETTRHIAEVAAGQLEDFRRTAWERGGQIVELSRRAGTVLTGGEEDGITESLRRALGMDAESDRHAYQWTEMLHEVGRARELLSEALAAKFPPGLVAGVEKIAAFARETREHLHASRQMIFDKILEGGGMVATKTPAPTRLVELADLLRVDLARFLGHVDKPALAPPPDRALF
jgi:hypothetical protein